MASKIKKIIIFHFSAMARLLSHYLCSLRVVQLFDLLVFQLVVAELRRKNPRLAQLVHVEEEEQMVEVQHYLAHYFCFRYSQWHFSRVIKMDLEFQNHLGEMN